MLEIHQCRENENCKKISEMSKYFGNLKFITSIVEKKIKPISELSPESMTKYN
jgi:hypothetical protein